MNVFDSFTSKIYNIKKNYAVYPLLDGSKIPAEYFL